MDDEVDEGGVEKWRNQRKWLARTRTIFLLVNSEAAENGGKGGDRVSLPHERMKTGSFSLTMGKWRRLPM